MKKDRTTLLFEKLLKIFHIKLKPEKEKLFLQIFKFLFVGGLAFIIDYAILIICKEVFHLDVLLSAAIAFTISVIANYILSVTWVFDVDKEKSKTRNFIIFIVFSIIGLGLTELIMWFGTDILNISYLIVKIIATAIVMVFNFITRKLFLE
ncbi:MAG: GtrA family protein [Bacilli bacterium]|nr:GtrA family protein [Bacilli bacterium]